MNLRNNLCGRDNFGSGLLFDVSSGTIDNIID